MRDGERQDQRVLEWIGGIPNRWGVHSLGSQLAANKSSNKGLVESRVLSLSYGRVIVKPIDKLRGLVPESFETYQIVEPGDIVIRPTDLQNDQTSLRVGQSMHRGIITSAYICLRPTDSLNHRYASYLLAAYDFMKVFYGFGSGLRQNLDVKHIKHIPVPVPSLEEQGLIVRYLDHAELRIAKAIAAKQRMINLLEEKKQVVAEEIIFGRDQTGVELLNSEVPWIGHVPKHWELSPCRAYLRRRKVLVGRGHGGHVLLSLTLRGLIVRDLSQMKGKFPASFESYQRVEPGDFVFCLFDVDETPRTVGLAHVGGMITGAYDVFECTDESIREYLYEYFLTIDRAKKLKPLYRGLRKTVPSNAFASMRIPIPPVAEREALVRKLKASTSAVDAAVESLVKELILLKEYRTRLISDVVTGKLDVRDEAAKLPEIDPMELATVAVDENGDDEEATDGE